MSALISISFCAAHWKGAGPGQGSRVGSQQHWEWLEAAVDFYSRYGLPVAVAMTGFEGILEVNQSADDHSRDVAWRVWKRAEFLPTPHNPSHQVGAALCVRLGLEAAGKWGHDFLLHTAEDVVPTGDAVERMLGRLEKDPVCEYAGLNWGEGASKGLCGQFFACRVPYLASRWDAAQVPAHRHIEGYLEWLLEGKAVWLGKDLYRHSHSRPEWEKFVEEENGRR